MKYAVIFLLALCSVILTVFLISCGSSPVTRSAKIDSTTNIGTHAVSEKAKPDLGHKKNRDRNDTTRVLKSARFQDVFNLSAYHIIFSDNQDSLLQLAYSTGGLPKWYNFDNFHSDLQYDNSNGIYMLRKLYLTHVYYDTIKPIAIYFSGDTLFTSDTFSLSHKASKSSWLHFEEVFYTFQTRRPFARICDYDFIHQDGYLQSR